MSVLHPIELTNAILDPIHGLMRLSAEEISIINHPLFQRLRNIKQNGMLHLTFPSATHTRFEHSLGVLFVADSILQALVFNSAQGKGAVVPYQDALPGQAFDLAAIFAEDQQHARLVFRIARLAGLAHDLGHGPLSHTYDSFAPRAEAVASLLDEPDLAPIAGLKGVLLPASGRLSHEAVSCLLFTKIWGEIAARSPVEEADRDMPLIVSAAILGERALVHVPQRWRPWIPLVHDIIASAPADADRMDYLERDSRSCGVTYGLFDRNRLLKTMLCCRSLDGHGTVNRLGLKFSGSRAVENFVQARFELYVQVYYHKTNRAAESMLGRIAEVARENDLNPFKGHNAAEFFDYYAHLGDESFFEYLMSAEVKARAPEAARLAKDVYQRRLWKRVYDAQEHLSNRPDPARLQSLLMKEYPGEKFAMDRPALTPTKDFPAGALLIQRADDGTYRAVAGEGFEKASKIIQALDEEEKSVFRIYLMRSDRADARRCRDRLNSLIAQGGPRAPESGN